MTEYWLQKKGLGGWSMVTWYSDQDQAFKNYLRCIDGGMSGYSWRLCKVEAIEVSMLDEVTEIQEPTKEINGGDIPFIHHHNNTKETKWIDPKEIGWNSFKLSPKMEADVNNAWANFKTCNTVGISHGLSGSVWVINHSLKQKKRVAASEVDSYLAQGYVKGGPKTKFEE